MKNLKLFSISLCLLVLISCEKNEFNSQNGPNSNSSSTSSKDTKPGRKSGFHIYYAHWTEWGRANINCNGWGLCQFEDCWFCCTSGSGNIVNCDNLQPEINVGTIVIDDLTNDGDMSIELDPTISEQEIAIENQLTFYVDEDIESDNFIIYKGEYEFNPEVGSYGGYRLYVCKK